MVACFREWLLVSSVWEIGMFLCDNQWKFQTFSILWLWNKFSGKRKPFSWNHWDWKHIVFIQNCSVRNQWRQIEWQLHNGPITKSWVLPVITLFFWKFFFQFWNLLKSVDLMYQQPKCPYSYFPLALEFNFRALFPCEYP